MFEYALGVIDVLEKNVFDHADQKRMISVPDKEAAFKVLFDTDLAEASLKEKDIEKILEKDLAFLKDFILKTVKDEKIELFWFLFLKFDALNLKIALKERFSENLYPENYFEHSIINHLDLRKKIDNNKYYIKNEYIDLMVEKSKSLLKAKKIFRIEEIVDIAYLETKLKIAEKIGGLPLKIIKLEIDIANLKNLIKGKDKFVNGGNLSKENLINLLDIDKGEFSKNVEKFLETYGLSLILRDYKKTDSETKLEKQLEKFLSEEIFKTERDQSGGIDKIVAFFYRKINSQANIRLIFFAKENGLALEEVENNILPIL